MAGGLMTLVSQGQINTILNSNPSKTFWKAKYKKYSNFGKQNFTLNYEGTPTLNLTTESTFQFKVKRYADLLMDCYICVTLPSIWSPIYPPQLQSDGVTASPWVPYEFKWIDYLGAQIINRITITCGNQKLQEYTGRYILSAAQRDFSGNKLAMFYEMIGHVPELNNPAFANGRPGLYPSAYYTKNAAGAQPSIPGRTLLIPLGSWFSLNTAQAFPLVSLQYNELQINVTFRPVNQWFTIRDVLNEANGYPEVAPNFNQFYMQMYRFLQTPPTEDISSPTAYVDTRTSWNAAINMNCTYCFLSNDEQQFFAKYEQQYLIKQVYEKWFNNVTGPNKVDLDSMGMVISWMFYFQRSDANLRNQWSNYTNWAYANEMPKNVEPAPEVGDYPNPLFPSQSPNQYLGPGMEANGRRNDLVITGTYSPLNLREILVAMGIVLDGQYRENILQPGVYNFVEKYVRTSGYAPPGLYCYNFCLNTSPFDVQPSGAMNMSRFTNIQLEFTTISPPFDPYAQVLTICDPNTQEIVAVNKPTWRIYMYNFDLYVMEERVNMVTFVGGNAGLLYAT